MSLLLIATHNQGKLREYRRILADLQPDIIDEITDLKTVGITLDVEETGETFADNAQLKAVAYAELSGLWTWADDSGLEVDLLDGAPGVYSARYAGPGATDEDRYLKLIDELQAISPAAPGEVNPQWSARFRCVVALVNPESPASVHFANGTCEGIIIPEPRGDHGFGYDPVFYMPAHDCTMAELTPEVKNQISHRANASQAAKELLRTILA